MFSVRIKGERNATEIELVKLKIVFYKTGYDRAEKVLYITGLYSDWQKDLQCFVPSSGDNISKNSLLRKEKLKYLKIAEKWENFKSNWNPIELAHYYDKDPKVQNRYSTVSDIIDQMMEMKRNSIRIRNCNEFTFENTVKRYAYLKRSLKMFVNDKYHRDFSKIQFRDIDNKFLNDYIVHEKQKGAKNQNRGGVCTKLCILYDVVKYAQNRKLYNVNLSAFDSVRNYMRQPPVFTKAVSHETIMKIEQVDRSILRPCEHLYLDLFLFSYYAGGMSGIDICFLEHRMINDERIEYERMKTDKRARVILTDKAREVILKYKPLSYMNYVFPIFKRKNMTEQHKYDRLSYVTLMVGRTVRKVCLELGIRKHISWGTARSSFICKMLDEGYHVFQIAEMTGNSPMTIYTHYYGITNSDKIQREMHKIFTTSKYL